MTYQVRHTETTNPAKPALTVADQTLNNETSISFVGKNYAGFAPVLAENFLHILENFANSVAPSNPVEGQLWYDNSAGVNLLKVYDGTSWNPSGSIKKAASAPLVVNSTLGDLWVDTGNQQLYLFSGSSWLLVGPQFSEGLKTGPAIETIVDTNNVSHNVVSLYSENYRIAITSKGAFTPKSVVSGFPTINQGLNLSTVDATSTTAPTKFWGTASQADSLVVNNIAVASSNFLRSDQPSISNYSISVRSNGGISVGSDLNFNIGTDGNSTVLYSKTSGNSVDFKLNSAGTPTTVMHLDANARVGLGPNNTNPQETLDVDGNIRTTGSLVVIGTADSTAVGSAASIATNGGLSVDKRSNFGGDVSIYGKTYLNNLTLAGDPLEGSVLLPGPEASLDAAVTSKYDLGSASRKFRNVYADSFVGNFTGSFTGTSFGNLPTSTFAGSASRLASTTSFSLTGDVLSNVLPFNGVTTDGTATFTTTITQDIITSKSQVSNSLVTDEFLIYRPGAGLKKISKQTIVSNIPTMPTGAILPYAGTTAPAGYLLCDGSEVRITDYPTLYGVIGYTYRTPSLLIGLSTFALPDMRGRFPLGRDDMDNSGSVPSRDNSAVYIDAGGGPANRVTDVTADTVGAASGSESRSLSTVNLPEHTHNLNSGLAQYYASGLPGAGTDPNAVPDLGMPNASTGSGLPNSGGVNSSRLGVAFNTMNPYQTINYIIFTGALA